MYGEGIPGFDIKIHKSVSATHLGKMPLSVNVRVYLLATIWFSWFASDARIINVLVLVLVVAVF